MNTDSFTKGYKNITVVHCCNISFPRHTFFAQRSEDCQLFISFSENPTTSGLSFRLPVNKCAEV